MRDYPGNFLTILIRKPTKSPTTGTLSLTGSRYSSQVNVCPSMGMAKPMERHFSGSHQLTSPRGLSSLYQFIRLRSFRCVSKSATAEFAKQMLHMPGVIHTPPRLAADASQMAKADDDVHFKSLSGFIVALPKA
jgi:hypothetical protein